MIIFRERSPRRSWFAQSLDGVGRSAHRVHDILRIRPGFTEQLGEQSAPSLDHHLAVNENLELSSPAFHHLGIDAHRVLDSSGVTRRLLTVASGLAVDDLDVHARSVAVRPQPLIGDSVRRLGARLRLWVSSLGAMAAHPSLADLLLEDAALLDEVIDDLGLVAVDPAGEGCEEQLKAEDVERVA